MKTEIRFLQELREDLAKAARLESEPSGGRSPRRPRRDRRRVLQVVGAVAGVVVVLSGIVGYVATGGGSGSSKAYVGSRPPHERSIEGDSDHRVLGRLSPGDHPKAQPSSSPAGVPPAGGAPVPTAPPEPAGAQVKVIKTARLELELEKGTFKERFSEALRIADTFGGFVQSSSTGGDKLRFGGMILRIPVGDFEDALAALRGLGRVERQQVNGRDVTQEFVDLEARLRNALVEEARLRAFLREAPTVEASLKVNQVLSQVELEIERLRGELRYLEDRTDLSTIDLELAEKAPKEEEPKPPAQPTHETFGGAWRKAVDGFFGVATSVVVGLGYVLPLSVVLLLAGAIIWALARLVRSRIMA